MNRIGLLVDEITSKLAEAATVLDGWAQAATAAAVPIWTWIVGLAAAVTNGWNPANSLALVASFLALGLGIYNNIAALRRERFKNEREEFHRRVATQIEGALGDFDAVLDLVQDLLPNQDLGGALDAIEKRSQIAQRKLSRSLRRASGSQLCQNQGWADLGSAGYDDFVASLEDLRSADTFDAATTAKCAEAIEATIDEVRRRVETELRRFT